MDKCMNTKPNNRLKILKKKYKENMGIEEPNLASSQDPVAFRVV